jgi:hypothetical protein
MGGWGGLRLHFWAHPQLHKSLTLRFSTWHLSLASDVINDMNSETHSCTVSFASLAILAFCGRARAKYTDGKRSLPLNCSAMETGNAKKDATGNKTNNLPR